jgi:hypothetical protein
MQSKRDECEARFGGGQIVPRKSSTRELAATAPMAQARLRLPTSRLSPTSRSHHRLMYTHSHIDLFLNAHLAFATASVRPLQCALLRHPDKARDIPVAGDLLLWGMTKRI